MSVELSKQDVLQLSDEEINNNESESGEVNESNQSGEVNLAMKAPKRKRGFSIEKRRAVAGWIFVSPFLIGFVVFLLYPLVESFRWSMGHAGTSGPGVDEFGRGGFHIKEMVGLANYGNIISSDYNFTKNFVETLERTFLWTPFIIVFSLFIAIMLNRKIKFRGVFRVIYFLPVLLGTGLVFSKLSTVTSMLTIPEQLTTSIQYIFRNEDVEKFLADLLVNIINMFWKMGVQIIIFLAGLQGISDTYYEAAKVDSANWWDMLWKITIPMISPMILLNTVYTIIDSFRDEGNPIVKYILDQYGKARWVEMSTMGWMYFVVTLLMLGLVFLATRRFVFYEK